VIIFNVELYKEWDLSTEYYIVNCLTHVWICDVNEEYQWYEMVIVLSG